MVATTLAERMLLWGQLKLQLLEVEEKIKAQVMEVKETQEAGRVRAVYSEGRGSYDWKNMADFIVPNEEILSKFTTQSTDWKKVCEATGVPDEIKQNHYSPGKPTVSLKIEAK